MIRVFTTLVKMLFFQQWDPTTYVFHEGKRKYLFQHSAPMVCYNSGFTSLATIFQSYFDSVCMRQEAQCSLLDCCLTEISCPRQDIPPCQITLTSVWPVLVILSDSKIAPSTIFNILGMTQPWIELTTSWSKIRHSTIEPLCWSTSVEQCLSHIKIKPEQNLHFCSVHSSPDLTLVLLNEDIPWLCKQCRSTEANWSGSALFAN